MPAQKIIVRPENHWKSVTSLTLIRSKSIVPRSWTSTNWNDASTASGPLWVTVIEGDNVEWHACVRAGADILSTHCNKDDVMWHVWLFLRDSNYKSCYCLLPFSYHSNTQLLCWRLNLTLQISQGSASTYFRSSGQFRYSFVEGLFRDSSSNFHWNRYIFDRQGAKYKLAQFFWDTVYINVPTLFLWQLLHPHAVFTSSESQHACQQQ